MCKKIDEIHNYNTAWNSYLSVTDISYKMSSSLPTQVYKVYGGQKSSEDNKLHEEERFLLDNHNSLCVTINCISHRRHY